MKDYDEDEIDKILKELDIEVPDVDDDKKHDEQFIIDEDYE